MPETYPIRTISADEFVALTEVPAQAFLQTWPAEGIEHERTVIEYDRTISAFDDELMVGSGSAHSFQLTVPGGNAAAAGVTLISVLPAYRRRGILTGLMDCLLADAADRGEPVAILFSSQAAIYGRFGFGLATMHQRLQLDSGAGLLAAGGEAEAIQTPRLRDTEPRAAVAELAAVFDRALSNQPGVLARPAAWWDYLLADVPSMRPPGASPLRCTIAADDDGPRGYALYRTQPGRSQDYRPAGSVRIRELTATDPAATAALWTDLLSRDLVSEVIAPMQPVGDPMLAMLADPRQARPAPVDGLWLRLIDVPAALCQRRYSCAADLVLEVSDRVLGENSGRWRLRTAGPDTDETPTCERTGAPADVRVPVQALGAGYLGAPRFAQLAAAGHVAELTPGALARLSTAMSWDPAPFSPMMF
jgi:predicted acetyltransferase